MPFLQALLSPETPARTITLYFDHEDFRRKWTTRLLTETLEEEGFTVAAVHRHEVTLDRAFLDKTDQVWFFLKSTDERDKLTEEEVSALRTWMDGGGGVLITGDHGDGVSRSMIKPLGAPIGRQIPRAGHLRVWDADKIPGPTLELGSTNSTWNASTDQTAEEDASAQRLLVASPRHPIFSGGLDLFPDHRHEGLVVEPCVRPGEDGRYPEEWFREGELPRTEPPPRARIIARGIDWERGVTFPLMAAWEDRSGLGRILADASWHHYVDQNLVGFAGETLVKIRRLYRNIANHLMPARARERLIAQALRAAIPADLDLVDNRVLGEWVGKVLQEELSPTLAAEARAWLSDDLAADPKLELEHLPVHLAGERARRIKAALDQGDDDAVADAWNHEDALRSAIHSASKGRLPIDEVDTILTRLRARE
ncbi:MAG: hypothetical protein R3B09_24170 [Nannocystaceae bacterium]